MLMTPSDVLWKPQQLISIHHSRNMKGQQLVHKDGAYSSYCYCIWYKLIENILGIFLKKFICENTWSHDKHKNLPSVRPLRYFTGSASHNDLLSKLKNHPQYCSILHNKVKLNNINWFTCVNINRKHQSNCINMLHLTLGHIINTISQMQVVTDL